MKTQTNYTSMLHKALATREAPDNCNMVMKK